METISNSAIKYVEDNKAEDFHEFLRAYTDIFSKNIYATKDFTYKNLKKIINNDKLAIVSGDNDSCVVIMTREDYNDKLEAMLNDETSKGIYARTEDTTLRDLKLVQDFLRRNFKDKYNKNEEMRPVSHEPGKLYATAKTHKFNSLDDITVDNLKFRPIISQIGTYTYNASRVISQYLKPLCENEYKINDTQTFASMIKNQAPLSSDEEYVSYDVDSFFTNIPVEDNIEYIIHQIYNEKKVLQICSKTFFRRLIYKSTTECAFQFNQNLFKQAEGCSMGGPLSVTLADIHMIRTEKDIVTPLKSIFYKRFVGDIYTRRKKGIHDKLYERLNNYHPNIKLTIEINPNKFLDTEIILKKNGVIKTKVYRKTTKLPVLWASNIPKRYKRNTINTDLYRAKRIATNLDNELVIIKRKFLAANYPYRFINSVINMFIEKENKKEEYLIPQKIFRNSKTRSFN